MDDQSPYERWLEIPSDYCPPNHYILLGIEEFSSDADAIDAAAKERTAYLHQLASGPGRKEIQKLLGEVAVARRTLLNDDAKSEYDAWLSEPDEEDLVEEKVEDPAAQQAPVPVQRSAPNIGIQLADEDRSVSKRTAKKKRRPPPDPDNPQPRTRRKKKSAWDAYKYHAISASILGLAVFGYWFMNQGGGRRAASVPTKANSTPMSGAGFKKQTATSSGLGAKKKFTAAQKRKMEKKGLGNVIKNPLDSLSETPNEEKTKPVSAADSPATAPKSNSNSTPKPTLKPNQAKEIKLESGWDNGLKKHDLLNDKFSQNFRIAQNKGVDGVFQMKDGKLWIRHVKSNAVRTKSLTPKKGPKLAMGQSAALTTNLKENINGQAGVGLLCKGAGIRVRSSPQGIRVITSGNPSGQREIAGATTKVTILIQRDATDPKLVHWLVNTESKSLAGSVRSTQASKSPIAPTISVAAPKAAKAMQHQVWAGDFRSGKLAKPIDWP